MIMNKFKFKWMAISTLLLLFSIAIAIYSVMTIQQPAPIVTMLAGFNVGFSLLFCHQTFTDN